MDKTIARQKIQQKYSPIIRDYFNNVKKADSTEDFKKFLPSMSYLIYIHIPFCNDICRDCPYSRDSNVEDIEKYCDCLINEIELLGRYKMKKKAKPVAVYFGGGTPSLLPMKTLTKIMEKLKQYFLLDHNPEISMEINPSSLDFSRLDAYKDLGINRLSLGIQSFNDDVLKEMGRTYTGEEARNAVKKMAKTGWNFNIDLMYGFDSQTSQMIYDDVDYAVNNGVSHMATYNLVRKMSRDDTERAYVAQSEMYYHIREQLKKAGFVHYFINEYARTKDTICEYTLGRVKLPIKENMTFGTAALGGTEAGGSYQKFKGRNIYTKSIEKKRPPAYFLQSEDPHIPLTVYLIDIIRAMRKMNTTIFKRQFGVDPTKIEFIKDLVKYGFIKIDNRILKKDISLNEDYLFQYNVFYNDIYFNIMRAPADPKAV